MVSLGTSGTIFAKSPSPVLDPTGVICPFCDATGAYLPLLCTLNCTRVLEEVCRSRTSCVRPYVHALLSEDGLL